MAKEIRIQKYIADCGITSRRKAEELMLEGVVKKNGLKVTQLGTKMVPGEDMIEVRGELIDHEALERLYIVMNKPRGVVSTVSDPEGRETVIDLCRGIKTRIYPVGRLDYLSEGLLILTNDGDLTQKILHPKFEITKVYEVKVFGVLTEVLLNKLREGVRVDGDFLKPLSVRVIKQLRGKTWLEFKLNEGKNREIRKICESCDLTIDKLRRVAIGNLSLTGLKPGEFQIVSRKELLNSMGLNKKGEKVQDFVFDTGKKSVRKRKRLKFRSNAPKSDEKVFKIFRKENYFETLNKRKAIEKEKQATKS